jgi:ubiquinone/menaquinone biosynthesis C-methylase UbiE
MANETLFNAERTQRILRMYETPDVVRRRKEAIDALAPRSGERILDVGCGPAVFAADVADRIGPEGRVVAVDQSAEMLDLARRTADAEPRIEVREGDATRLPVEGGEFDAAVSVQVLEYVPDVPQALHEIHRALRPGGRVLLWDTDWNGIMWHSSDEGRMQRMLREWEHHLAHPTLPRTLARELRDVGFAVQRVAPYCLLNLDAGVDTYSGGIISLIESFVRSRGTIEDNEIDSWSADLRTMSDEGSYFFCIPAVYFIAERG